ncbi:MAG: DUF1343 domain-containing protein [Gammaproteobacteria bacterium]|nr:DUF1343 domain-containing protein [Gammaproteobacteria bacterium]
MRLGVDRLIEDGSLSSVLKGRRVALLTHPAAMTGRFVHSLDALAHHGDINLSAAFGPQHGIRGDKQDNMVETEDGFDPVYNIPVFSLYGRTRRLTPAMADKFDVLLVDLQDVGCRIYTFLSTLFYLLEDCAASGKELWVLDRPNPAGRPIEGSLLEAGMETFVGVSRMPIRHGLTLGEAAHWYVQRERLDIQPRVIALLDYDPREGPGYGWPSGVLPWVNPSPNLATLNAARAYAGTVLMEGTTLSEGRGTTRPLEMVGAPDLDMDKILARMGEFAPNWLAGCRIRRCHFEPTFHKHAGRLCSGFQIHTDYPGYDHDAFKPYRLMALFLKILRREYPEYGIWRDFPYEYISGSLPIDAINGSDLLRRWVDGPDSSVHSLEEQLRRDEGAWRKESREFYLYP